MQQSVHLGIARGHVPAKCRCATPSLVLFCRTLRVSHLRTVLSKGCHRQGHTSQQTQACIVPKLAEGSILK